MIRNISKTALLAAAVITAGTAFVNCSKNHSDDDIGSLQLALTLSPGVIVNTVTLYDQRQRHHADQRQRSTCRCRPPRRRRPSCRVYPSRNNYLVAMHADSTDNMTHCDGQANFNVLLGQTAMANVTLQCRGPRHDAGQVAINGRLDNCPFITASVGEPPAGAGGRLDHGQRGRDRPRSGGHHHLRLDG